MLFSGPGAGSLPTASAVFADLLDFGSDSRGSSKEKASSPTFELVAMDQVCVPHYLRIIVLDKPGIMAEVTKILSESEISIEAVIQKESEDESDNASIVILTDSVEEHVMQKAKLSQLIFDIPTLISYISKAIPWRAGDVLVTGTPGGVGFKRKPPVFMKEGDKVEVEISEIGVLSNIIKDEKI